MDNVGIAQNLQLMASILELKGENPFKVKAYAQAAQLIEELDIEVVILERQDRVRELKGIGPGLAAAISELIATRRWGELETLREQVPAGLPAMLAVPHLTPKRLRALHEGLGVSSIAELEAAIASHRVAELSGFGEKTESTLAAGLELWKASQGLFVISEAMEAAEKLGRSLEGLETLAQVELTGALRRGSETVREIEFVLATTEPDQTTLELAGVPHLDARPAPPGYQGAGRTYHARLTSGLLVRLHLVAPSSFGAALVWTTGSAEVVEALARRAEATGLRLDATGLWQGDEALDVPREADVFARLGVAAIAPELREDAAALERAASPLVEREHLQGLFHVHTRFSDGRGTLEQMVKAAKELGYRYIGISDHSQAAAYANGLSLERIEEQHAEIDRLNRELKGIRIFKGIEADILADGSIDHGSEVLSRFDFVIASLHSRFGMGHDAMTERMVKALANPFVTMLGHMSGRWLLNREAYEFDRSAVLLAAQKHGVIVELNASPFRLDIDWRYLHEALELGLRISINPDAHSVEGLRHVRYGLTAARKGGLAPDQVFNTMPLAQMETYLSERRDRALASGNFGGTV